MKRALLVNIFVVAMSLGVVAPVLPLIQQEFAVSYGDVSWGLTGFALARLVTNIPAGRFSTSARRGLRLVFAGALVVGAGGVATALAPSLGAFVAARAITGIGSGFVATAGLLALIGTAGDDDRGRLGGVHQAWLSAGALTGPGLGGLLAELAGWRPAVLGIGLATGLSAVHVATAIRSEASASPVPDASKDVAVSAVPGRTPMPTTALVALAGGFAFFFVRGGVQQTLLPLAASDRAGLGPSQVSLLLVSIGAMSILLGPRLGSLADRGPAQRRITTAACLALLAAGSSLALLTSEVVVLTAGVLLLALGAAGASVPATTLIGSVAGAARGRVFGTYRVVGDAALVVSPVGLGYVAEHAGFGVAGAIAAAVALCIAGAAMLLGDSTTERSSGRDVIVAAESTESG